ncbi:hypothetical protein KKH07_00130 [Patescibacteria group bacterium]|nr:hypothetical protein [Patescibacteria group bacterium]MBU1563722.1 hypothetical protein [Patescibacteria group bacterium]
MKNIYLEPNEEIISVVDRLVQADDNEINLVVPTGAQIWQSSINLKLLKREANILNKAVTFIVTDDLSAEMAERTGFLVKKERELPVELIQQEEDIVFEDSPEEVRPQQRSDLETIPEETETETETEEEIEKPAQLSESRDNMIDLLVDELESEKKAKKPLAILSGWKKKEIFTQKRMADIVTPVEESKSKFFSQSNKLTVKKEPVKVESVIQPRIFSEVEKKTGSSWSKLMIIFIIVALIVAGFVSYLILPNAEINITLKTEALIFDLSVVGLESISQINESLNQIPLQEVEVTKTKDREFTATGERDIKEKASGRITVYNEYSSSPQVLVATTRFESSDGKIFRILESVTVPGAKIEEGKIIPSIFEIEIIADQAGEEYNIGPSDFVIPGFKGTAKYAGFYGRSSESMSGGYIGRANVVLAEDLEKAKETLIKELKDEVQKILEDQIPTNLKVLEGGLKEEITKISSSHNEGEQADKFTIEIKVIMKALLFKEDDLKSLVGLNSVSKISGDKVLIEGTQKISWQAPEIDWLKGEASFSLNVEEKVAQQIDIQSLKDDLVGQDEVEVRRYLASQPEIERAQVSFWPFWVNKIPTQEKKIKVNIEL